MPGEACDTHRGSQEKLVIPPEAPKRVVTAALFVQHLLCTRHNPKSLCSLLRVVSDCSRLYDEEAEGQREGLTCLPCHTVEHSALYGSLALQRGCFFFLEFSFNSQESNGISLTSFMLPPNALGVIDMKTETSS